MKYPRLFMVGLMIALLAFATDMLSKWYMLDVVEILERPPIAVTGFFNLVAVWNTGISFGILSEHDQPLLLIGSSSFIILILLVWLSRVNSKFMAASLGLVIGGAAGNVVDRVRFGKVFDFMDFYIGPWHWPAFNIADSTIFIGVVLLCIHSMFLEQKPDQKEG